MTGQIEYTGQGLNLRGGRGVEGGKTPTKQEETPAPMDYRRAATAAWSSVVVMALLGLVTFAFAARIVHATPPADVSLSLQSGGFTRTYLVHAPANMSAKDGKALPLLIMLHGAGGDGKQAQAQTGWDKKADAEHFIAVFPDALPAAPRQPASFRANPRYWNDGSGRAVGPHTRIDDVAFLSALLDALEKRYAVDTKHIYLTGFSSGASMTFHAVASPALAGRIAAAAPVSGHFWHPADAAAPGRPVPLVLVFGTKDPLDPWEGGVPKVSPWGSPADRAAKPRVLETVNQWAKYTGCPAEPVLLKDEDNIKRWGYGPGKDGIEFVFVQIEGMGHRWPGGKETLPQSLVGSGTSKWNATDNLWTFLSRHELSLRVTLADETE